MEEAFFLQTEETGGMHTAPGVRILLYALAKLIGAQTILETGYDAGYTTRALALTGARVTGIDNLSEYAEFDDAAHAMLADYDNVTLIEGDAQEYLYYHEDESFDLIFIDDWHKKEYVRGEANAVERVLRSGGIAVFHDTVYHQHLGDIMDEGFKGWQRLDLPAPSPVSGGDMGITVLRKPKA